MEIAVVIPALDEADRIEAAISSVRIQGEDIEILVVDGGSRDATIERARAAGARVLSCEAGRARQLDLGWRAAHGDVILFLHADSRMGDGWQGAVRAALGDSEVVGGAFRLSFEPRTPALRLVEWGARLRAARFGMPYGDQAIFARRGALVAIGGVPRVPLMEDVDLVAALRARGRLVLLDVPVTTSARRHLAGGVLRTALRHALALVGWRLGVDRERLARWLGR